MSRICFISHKSLLGGAETSLLSAVKVLKSLGNDCYVILPHQGPLVRVLNGEGVECKIIYFKHWVTNRPSRFKKLARKLVNTLSVPFIASQLKRWKIDVVITNTITPVSGALAAKRRNIPHIWHIREFGKEDHNFDFDRGLTGATDDMDRLSNLLICNSKAVAAKYRNFIPSEKIKVLYNAVPVDHVSCPIDSQNPFRRVSSFKCIMVGSVSERKNQLEAIIAIQTLISDSSMDAELLIVGPAQISYKKELKQYIHNHGMENHIKFTGEIDNPLPFVKRADVFLMCSKMEAFGKVTVEAMKCGLPVIAANTGGSMELIGHKQNGLLYELGNPTELAQLIRYLYENPDIADRLARCAFEQYIDRFTPEEYGCRYQRLIKDLL